FWKTYRFHTLEQTARHLQHWTIISKVEIALLSGILVPIQLMAAATVVDVFFKYESHKEVFHAVFREAPRVLGLLWDLARQHPRLAFHLAKAAANELLFSALRGIGPSDVAFFLGRLLHGKRSGWHGLDVEYPAEITLRLAAGLILKTATLVFLSHSLPMAAHD